MPPVSQCQKSHITFLQAALNALEAAAHRAMVALIYTLADLVDALFNVALVALAGVVALANIFLAGVKAVVELVAGVLGSIASTIQSIVNALGGTCQESKSWVQNLKKMAAGLISLKNAVSSFADQITMWMNDVDATVASLTSGIGFAAYVKAHVS